MKLHVGLYEQVISTALAAEISEAESRGLNVESRGLDAGDSHNHLAKYLAEQLSRAFQSLPAEARIEKQVELANMVIDLLVARMPEALGTDRADVMRAGLLLSILRAPVERPDTPLTVS